MIRVNAWFVSRRDLVFEETPGSSAAAADPCRSLVIPWGPPSNTMGSQICIFQLVVFYLKSFNFDLPRQFEGFQALSYDF